MRKEEISLLKLTKRVENHNSGNTPIETFKLMLDIAKLNIDIMNKLEKYVRNAKCEK